MIEMLTMPPAVWGPIFWATIHIVALAYPDSPNYAQKRAAKEFFLSLAELIPCPICRTHYVEHCKKNPIEPFLDSRANLSDWTLKLHNQVNLSLGKPTLTREQFLKAYSDMCDRTLPIPPSPFAHKLAETADERAYIRGLISGSVGTLGLAGIGLAIYKSYA